MLFCVVFICNSSDAQNVKGNKKIGFTFSSLGDNAIIRSEELDDAVSADGDRFYSIGVNYIHPLNHWLEAETGLEYSRHAFSIRPISIPGMDFPSYTTDLSVLSLPVTLRANFLNYFFVNSGLLMVADISDSELIDSQTGIGWLLGIAVKYEFDFGATVFVNPYLKAHSLIPFEKGKYHQRLFESGFRFGMTFDLKKKN